MNPKSLKRIVVKVGTSSLTHPTGSLHLRNMDKLVRTITDLKNEGYQIILVTSGAIGVGMSKLGMKTRPEDIRLKQASAAVGQCELMHMYDKFFLDYGAVCGQILFTHDDIDSTSRRESLVNTLEAMLEVGAVPVINENDAVGVEEILFGDNDSLSAEVAVLANADLLVLFSDIDGLYDKDPHKNSDAKIIPLVTKVDAALYALAGGAGSKLGTGGMTTKLHAAEIAMAKGIPMVITNGTRFEALYDIVEGEISGTLFEA